MPASRGSLLSCLSLSGPPVLEFSFSGMAGLDSQVMGARVPPRRLSKRIEIQRDQQKNGYRHERNNNQPTPGTDFRLRRNLIDSESPHKDREGPRERLRQPKAQQLAGYDGGQQGTARQYYKLLVIRRLFSGHFRFPATRILRTARHSVIRLLQRSY